MVKRKRKQSVRKSIFDKPALTSFVDANGWKARHVKTFYSVVRKQATSSTKVSDFERNVLEELSKEKSFPKDMIEKIFVSFQIFSTTMVKSYISKDGTVKMLVQTHDDHKVECVVIPHLNRSTCCVSSQIGCAMGCKFCATGTMGILGDLHYSEILEQLMYAKIFNENRGRLNVVFMGMGEPLRNYENVRDTVLGMIDRDLFGMARRHITVSTVGVIENIKRLTKDLPGVSLALSLHAATQEKRESIVLSAKAYPLEKLMNAMDNHFRACELYLGKRKFAQTRMMIEYVLLKNVNDQEEDAESLKRLLGHRPAIGLNLIPYNPNVTAKLYGYEAPSVEEAQKFREMCRNRGLFVTLRIEHGQDIAAACGQLALSSDIEDAGGKTKNKKKKVMVTKRRTNNNTGTSKNQILVKGAAAFFFILSLVFLALYFLKTSSPL